MTTTTELLVLARDRLAQSRGFDVRLPYGPMDWTVLMLHGFWDSWLHERDVLLARGAEHPTDGDATAYATAYGVFIAAAVASRSGGHVHEKLTLSGDGGGIFEVDSRHSVTLTVHQSPRRDHARPRSRTPWQAAHRSLPYSPICPPTRVPLCRIWPTSSRRQPRHLHRPK